MFRTAIALVDTGSRRQCSTKLRAAESYPPSTGSGFITSASTATGLHAASRFDACFNTCGFGSRSVILVWIGGDAYRQLARVAGATRQRVGQIVKEADSSS